jgi:hypothetical protein
VPRKVLDEVSTAILGGAAAKRIAVIRVRLSPNTQ